MYFQQCNDDISIYIWRFLLTVRDGAFDLDHFAVGTKCLDVLTGFKLSVVGCCVTHVRGR